MEGSPFLPLPKGIVIDQVQITESQLTVSAISTQLEAACPGCGHPSVHVHSHYQRTVNDVPCGGRSVVLRLSVRKFFCRTATCPRKVFAERLLDLVRAYARVSNRLLEELKAIGLAASAEVSERLTPRLGMKVKAPTLLPFCSYQRATLTTSGSGPPTVRMIAFFPCKQPCCSPAPCVS
jgi:transposase